MNVPVLLLIHRRITTTQSVFDEIRKAQPMYLYVAADGPRTEVPGELEKCNEAREIINEVDWECEIRTLFRDKNLGCRDAVSSAIDWFFDNEDQGIILEDDCLPSQSFFKYCTELLDKYREDERIMCVSGSNYQQGQIVTDNSYYYSKYNHCTGWASWRRAWKLYDKTMVSWAEYRDTSALVSMADGNDNFIKYWSRVFSSASNNEVDSWAYRWTFSCWSQNGLTCLPVKNLVEHIGYGDDATHTQDSADWRSTLKAEELEFPLKHPVNIVRSVSADKFTDYVIYGIKDIKIHPVIVSILTPFHKPRKIRLFNKFILKIKKTFE